MAYLVSATFKSQKHKWITVTVMRPENIASVVNKNGTSTSGLRIGSKTITRTKDTKIMEMRGFHTDNILGSIDYSGKCNNLLLE